MIELASGEAALQKIGAADIEALTKAATDATFYRDGLRPDQIAHNLHIVEISGATAAAAATVPNQHLVVALAGARLAGFVLATVHDESSRELDWLMVHPGFHGSEVSAVLMRAGMDWLGADRPMWLNVIQYNERAIRFYRRFGFEIAADRAIPQYIMRRAAEPSG